MCSTILGKVLVEPGRARVCLFHNSLATLYQLQWKVSKCAIFEAKAMLFFSASMLALFLVVSLNLYMEKLKKFV